MPKQPDLLAISLDDVQPEAGRDEPRLWVRRLVIWRKPGDIIRDIPLKPGLNIVWSPDSGRPNEPMGHGGGKTSFCRLVRYCLGEPNFGTHMQREMITNRLPDGYVGTEVILDGVEWAVIRPLGIGNRHYCAAGTKLDSVISAEISNTGITPLREAITSSLMDEAADRMPLAHPRADAWEAALAWLSRDQECRLRSPLEWRAAQTETRSPSRQRQLSDADRLVIVRLLIKALRTDETAAVETARKIWDQIEKARAEQRRREWLINDLREGLTEALGASGAASADQTDFWVGEAATKLTTIDAAIPFDITAKLKRLHQDKSTAEVRVKALDRQIDVIDGRLTEKANLQKILDNTRATTHSHLIDAENPVCKTCGQRLTPEAVAFIEERRHEAQDAAIQFEDLVAEIGGLKSEQDSLKFQKASEEQALGPITTTIAQLEAQARRLAEAKGHVTMTKRYSQHISDFERSATAIDELVSKHVTERRKASELRRSSLAVIDRLSQLFDASLRFLVPDRAKGAIALDEDGLHLSLHIGGERSTAAIESLKIVAFDLAVLLMSMEGRTQLPAFLIHDSPREADLGRSIYNRFFELGRKMQDLGPSPLFQYIVTTTTAPPDEFRSPEWIKLELHGAPRERRLFMEDL